MPKHVDWPSGPRRLDVPSAKIHVWRAELGGGGGGPSHEILPTAERERAEAIKRPLSRQRWVASRWALRAILARYLREDPAVVKLRLGESGKPALADPTAPLRFNLSHSGALALIALVGGREVGVDIEEVQAGRNVVALSRRALDPAAAAAVLAAAPGTRPTAFHQAWTRREAIAKCLGSGFAAPQRSNQVCVTDLQPNPRYVAAVASEGHEALPHQCFSLGSW
jgi:4'-phosphopantetheinyl transferase